MGNLLSKNSGIRRSDSDKTYSAVLVACGGLALAFYGTRLSIVRGPEGVLSANAVLSVGMGVACLGIEKHVNRQPIHVKELIAEALYSANVGALSSVVSDRMESALQTRIATGALIGLVAKASDGVKELLTSGKRQNASSVSSVTVSWTIAALSGALGGAASSVCSVATKSDRSDLTRALVRVVINSASACLTDLLGQFVRVSTGQQSKYVKQRTALAGILSLLVSADLELAKASVYASTGSGRSKFLESKSNRQLIKENVSTDQQSLALEAYNELSRVPLAEIKSQSLKAAKHRQLSADLTKLSVERTQLEAKFNENIDRLTQEIMDSNVKRDYLASKLLRDELTTQVTEKNTQLAELSGQIQSCEQLRHDLARPNRLGSSQALARLGQVVCDANDHKIIFDISQVAGDEFQLRYKTEAFDDQYNRAERELDRSDGLLQQVSQVLVNTKLNISDCPATDQY